MFISLLALSTAFAQDSFSACAGQVASADRVGAFYLSSDPMRNCLGIIGADEIVNDTDYFMVPAIAGVPWYNFTVQGSDGLNVTVKTDTGLYKGGIPPRTFKSPTIVYGFMPTGNIHTKIGVSGIGYAVNSNLSWSESLIDSPLGFPMHIMSMVGVSLGMQAVQLEGSQAAIVCAEVEYAITPNVDGSHLYTDPDTGFKRITFTQGQYPCR